MSLRTPALGRARDEARAKVREEERLRRRAAGETDMSGVVRSLARGTSTVRADAEDWDPRTKTVRDTQPLGEGQSGGDGLDQGSGRHSTPPSEPLTRAGRSTDRQRAARTDGYHAPQPRGRSMRLKPEMFGGELASLIENYRRLVSEKATARETLDAAIQELKDAKDAGMVATLSAKLAGESVSESSRIASAEVALRAAQYDFDATSAAVLAALDRMVSRRRMTPATREPFRRSTTSWPRGAQGAGRAGSRARGDGRGPGSQEMALTADQGNEPDGGAGHGRVDRGRVGAQAERRPGRVPAPHQGAARGVARRETRSDAARVGHPGRTGHGRSVGRRTTAQLRQPCGGPSSSPS